MSQKQMTPYPDPQKSSKPHLLKPKPPPTNKIISLSPSINKMVQKHQHLKNKYLSNYNLSECLAYLEQQFTKLSPKKCYEFSAFKETDKKHTSKLSTNISKNTITTSSNNQIKNQPLPKSTNYQINIHSPSLKKKLIQSRSNSLIANLPYQENKKIQTCTQFNQNQYKFKSCHEDSITEEKIYPSFSTTSLQTNTNKQPLPKNLQLPTQNSSSNLKQTISTSSSNKITKFKITDFQLGPSLGKGKFGTVKLTRHKKMGMLFSLKIINKNMVKRDNIVEQLIKEIKIQSFFSHSHIVKLYSIFDDKQNIYLLLEFCNEGNLYDHMVKVGRISETDVSKFMKQACQGVQEMHLNKVIHRDIKPENIVLCCGMAKICDFGWSTNINQTMRETFCGSPLYVSPQLLRGELYDEKIDLWALGILGYEMLTGTVPFNIASQRDLSKIVHEKIVYPKWLSSLAKSFLSELLDKNPNGRTNIEDLLNHSFLNLPE